jgi:hypothetical protein
MKKKITLLCGVLFLIAIPTFAQSYAFYHGDTLLEDNAEITISNYSESDIPYTLSLESGLRLKNLTGNTVPTSLSQTVIVHPPEDTGFLGFCFVTCTTGNNDKTKTGSLEPNSFDDIFHINFYVVENVYALAKVKYEVFRPTDLSRTDKKTVFVTYDYNQNSRTGLKNLSSENKVTVFQERNSVAFDYAFDSNTVQLEVYALTGQKIAQHLLTSGTGIFTLPENLTKGVYVCTFKSEKGIVVTQKLVVR